MRVYVAISLITVAHLGFDLMARALIGSGKYLFADFLTTGVCVGQLNLIGAMAAFAPGRLIVRIPWSILLGLLVWYALLAGSRLADEPSMSLEGSLVLGAVILIALLVMQCPLWIARRAGWRFVGARASSTPLNEFDRQFSIGQMMFGVALLAVGLGLGRFVLPEGGVSSFDFLSGDLLIVLSAAVICNLLCAVPSIWWAFQPPSTTVACAIAWIIYMPLVTMVETVTLLSVMGGDPEAFWYFLLFNSSQCACIALTMFVFRGLEFQLVRSRR